MSKNNFRKDINPKRRLSRALAVLLRLLIVAGGYLGARMYLASAFAVWGTCLGIASVLLFMYVEEYTS